MPSALIRRVRRASEIYQARFNEEPFMNTRASRTRAIVTAVALICLTAAVIPASAQKPAAAADPEAAARTSWRAVIRNSPKPGKGCFHVSYPSVNWESVDCKIAKQPVHPLGVNSTSAAPQAGAGNGHDYVASVQGQGSLINFAAGKFFLSNVTSETGLCPECGGVSKPNEYSLQLNTNFYDYTTSSYIRTAACGDYYNCSVWQQFIYATDYNQQGEAALFMQYWLFNWTGTCPRGYWTSGTSCYKNSKYAAVPDIPVTDLGDVILTGGASNGGYDSIGLEYGNDVWSVTAADSDLHGGLDIATVWTQAEFNVVGDANYRQANFNRGSQITVLLQVLDGSSSAPACNNGEGTTGETNNMTLGACSTGVGTEPIELGCGNQDSCVPIILEGPYIEFAEYVPYLWVQPISVFLGSAL
jgi:hypothetical protein